MSKIPERIMFLHPGIYSSDKFRVKHIILKPSNPPSSKNYYTSGDSITWNMGGAPNQFIVPESAHLCFQSCVCPTSIVGMGDQDPWPLASASGGFIGSAPYGLPRVDYGLPFFDQINVTLDSSRNLVNINGASLCKAYLNGRIACGASSFIVDPNDFVDGDGVLASSDKCTATGPASLCGFLSNTRRIIGYNGMYRNRVNSATVNDRLSVASGAVNYKVPLSLFTGLLDPYASSYLPIGMMAQSSASGVTFQLRLTAKENCLVDSMAVQSLNPKSWQNPTHGIMRDTLNELAPDGTAATVEYVTGAVVSSNTLFTPPAVDFPDLPAATAEVKRIESYLARVSTSIPVKDGLGAKIDGCFFAMLEPVLIYKVVEVLDENLLNLMRASFNGQNVENIELGGQMMSVPRLLNIKYRSFNLNQRLIPSGVTSISFNISCTEPSLVANMIRLSPQEDEGKPANYSKATEPSNVFITRYQVKVGNSVYPLTPIETNRRDKWVIPDSTDILKHSNSMLKAFTAGATPQFAAIQEDARQNFSPWYDVDNADNFEDLSLAIARSTGDPALLESKKGFSQMRPHMISFQNHSTYEHERLDNSATGIDMRGIGSYNLELEVYEEGATGLVAPTKNYNLFITDLSDAILSVKRNAIDPCYQYAVY